MLICFTGYDGETKAQSIILISYNCECVHSFKVFAIVEWSLALGFIILIVSGRRRPGGPFHHKYPPPWTFLFLVVASSLLSIVGKYILNIFIFVFYALYKLLLNVFIRRLKCK